MQTIIATVALCYFSQGETAQECCLEKFTLNPPPEDKEKYKVTRCNGDCGRDNCLCVIMSPEEIIPRPPYTLTNRGARGQKKSTKKN